MIKDLSAIARGKLAFKANAETRFYLDPRGVEYAPIAGTDVYAAKVAGEPVQGSYTLAQSTFYTAYPFTVPVTFECYIKPNWAYDVATDQTFCKFYADAYDGAFVALYYNATDDKLGAKVYQNLAGGGGGAITSVAADLATVYTSNGQLQAWIRLTCVVSIGSITIYANGANPVTTNLFMNNIRKLCLFAPGNNVNCFINYIKVIPGLEATAAQILNHYKNVAHEQAYWGFQQCAIGRTRCDISTYCKQFGIEQKDGYKAAVANVDIKSYSGEFCADQYATYAPHSRSYNGTSTQKYLANTLGLTIEQMLYDIAEATDPPFEPLFYGTIDAGTFNRGTQVGQLTTISVQADDFIKQLAKRRVKNARTYDNYYLARATPASNSLWHEFAWLAAKREVYNYVGNSGFENATIGNSWLVSGTGAAVARSTVRPLIGTYSGNLTGTSGPQTLYQIISDTSSQPAFDAGMDVTLQAWVYLDDGDSITFRIDEYDGVTAGSYTTGTETHSGTGWQMYYLTHKIVDDTRDRVRISIVTDSLDMMVEGVMLTQGGAKQYYVENTTDGTAGVVPSSAATMGSYLQLGCVSEDVPYQHPYAYIDRGKSPWERICDVADASLARYMHIASDGILYMRSYKVSADETVSRGVLPNVWGLTQTQQNPIANKITVSGVKIIELPYLLCVWEAKSALLGNSNQEGAEFYYSIADGDYFPDLADYPGGLECVYDSNVVWTTAIRRGI